MPDPLPKPKPILLLGAAELGSSILTSLLTHPQYTTNPSLYPITLTLTPSTLTTPPPSRAPLLTLARTHSVTLHPLDLHTATPTALTALFSNYHTVIHAAGMAAPAGTQLRVTRAVLDAGVARYIPWQWGVDYDVIGPEAGNGLFEEQCAVRGLLRAQALTRWVVMSCGVFASFLFEEVWGVVVPEEREGRVRVRALGSWEDRVTVTAVRDIGRVAAEVVLGDLEVGEGCWGRAVFTAGETLSYGELAEVVGRVSGREVVREVWDRERFDEELRKDPENKLWKYRAVFGGGKGVSWPAEGTWSAQRGMKMEGVEEWMRRNWKQ